MAPVEMAVIIWHKVNKNLGGNFCITNSVKPKKECIYIYSFRGLRISIFLTWTLFTGR